MSPRIHSLLVAIGKIGLLVVGALFILGYVEARGATPQATNPPTQSQPAAADIPLTATTSPSLATTTIPSIIIASTTVSTSTTLKKTPSPAPAKQKKPAVTIPVVQEVARVQKPYNFDPISFDTLNTETRAALVNILCMPRGGGSLQPISGSGVIIDPRGVILTNAHVAQYVLLSENPTVDLSCEIRTGSPATFKWTAEVLYIPTVWIQAHVSDINIPHPTGTGEHDYALLRIVGTADASPLPSQFPSLPFDTREAIGFLNDTVLGAGYPAEFVGGFAAENNLFPVSSVSPINQLLTFATSTIDMIAIGGVVEAQGGSSGGAVVNAWGRTIGIISTTSDAPTTALRDLRAITLSYINRDLLAQTGTDLATFLSGDLVARELDFNTNTLPNLEKLYTQVLSGAGTH